MINVVSVDKNVRWGFNLNDSAIIGETNFTRQYRPLQHLDKVIRNIF